MKKNVKKLLPLLILLISVNFSFGQSIKFGGKYKMDYGNQHMELIPQGGRYYTANFTGDCNARTVEGSVQNGVLSFDIIGSRNGKITMVHRGDKIDIDVSDIQVVRNSCNGASIEGTYSFSNNKHDQYTHQSHHHSNNNYSHYDDIAREDAYERGHKDGLYNMSYNNIYGSNHKNDYSSGYESGVGQRNNNTSYHSGHGGYQNHVNVSDLDNMNASSAYNELKSRGFRQEGEFVGSGDKHRLFKIWYNSNTKQCVKTADKNGKITMVQKSDKCRN